MRCSKTGARRAVLGGRAATEQSGDLPVELEDARPFAIGDVDRAAVGDLGGERQQFGIPVLDSSFARISGKSSRMAHSPVLMQAYISRHGEIL